MAFVKRRINLKFELGPANGSFGPGGENVVELTGLRCTANIDRSGGIVGKSSCDLRIYGMSLELMNKLTLLNKIAITNGARNIVSVSAGNDINGVSLCFRGEINAAWADMSSAPDVVFLVSAITGTTDTLRPVPPVTYKGTVEVASVVAAIGLQMSPPRSLENSGVSQLVKNPYFPGTALAQLESLARQAGFQYTLDDAAIIAIWPKGEARNGLVSVVSPETGMVGYPAFAQNEVQLTTLFNPSLVFGCIVDVRSALDTANDLWRIKTVNHNLDAETPNGQWFTRISCYRASGPGQVAAR